MFEKLINKNLVWFPEKGFGYYPVSAPDGGYNSEYFEKYVKYSKTDLGVKITKARINFVNWYHTGSLVDIGIGCGDFLKVRGNTLGYDINPKAISWLKTQGVFFDIYSNSCEALSFWDSLEHIKNPEVMLKQATKWAFVSIPTFTGPRHVLKSKHFRKDEHYWYFTAAGLIAFFREQGFRCVEVTNGENRLGREDIETFAFKRNGTDG